MSCQKLIYIFFLVLLFAAQEVNSYNINPINRSVIDEFDSSFRNKVSEPVHEYITRAARKAYTANCSANELCIDDSSVRTIQDSLIRGVWWNDDPNQNLYKGRQAVWLGYMKDAKRRANSSKFRINDSYKMQYRSHYGDMQFLHSMASEDNETIENTREKILAWAEFSYKVSTGEIGRESFFSDIEEMAIHRYFERHSKNGWKIKWLLQPRYFLRDTENDFQKHALGTLLHMVQDSYSMGHTSRTFTPSDNCPFGKVEEFFNYAEQDPNQHIVFDTYKNYVGTSFPQGLGPVEISTQLIRFSINKSDWGQEVLPFLLSHVYCI